jgi:hypothetical protein
MESENINVIKINNFFIDLVFVNIVCFFNKGNILKIYA